jgi:hypothetical protein
MQQGRERGVWSEGGVRKRARKEEEEDEEDDEEDEEDRWIIQEEIFLLG